jgi:hypothetical protein
LRGIQVHVVEEAGDGPTDKDDAQADEKDDDANGQIKLESNEAKAPNYYLIRKIKNNLDSPPAEAPGLAVG